jgi:hypothetical protein
LYALNKWPPGFWLHMPVGMVPRFDTIPALCL